MKTILEMNTQELKEHLEGYKDNPDFMGGAITALSWVLSAVYDTAETVRAELITLNELYDKELADSLEDQRQHIDD